MLVDPAVWRACAGATVKLPAVGSRVYYFPQGHVESSSSPAAAAAAAGKPYRLCHLTSISFLVDPHTEEVFLKYHLTPSLSSKSAPQTVSDSQDSSKDSDSALFFFKILSPSDANNGGAFSVPKHGADCVFPELDMVGDAPTQCLNVRDLVGNEWVFKHVYRGTPRRHLLTNGWSKFVDAKKMVAGDTVVFAKSPSSGEIFVGIRRKDPCGVVGEGLVRDGKGRVSAERVVEAVRGVEEGREFEVEFYPRRNSAEYVVGEERMWEAMKVRWEVGVRLKYVRVSEDCTIANGHKGTVERVVVGDGPVWGSSPWRMLKIVWDDPHLMPNMDRMSPWQVELLPPTQDPYVKRRKVSQKPVEESDSTLAGCLSPLYNFIPLPAGMQGARQDLNCAMLILSNPRSNDNNRNQPLNSNDTDGSKLTDASSNLSATMQSESSSSLSQENLHQHDSDHSSNAVPENPIMISATMHDDSASPPSPGNLHQRDTNHFSNPIPILSAKIIQLFGHAIPVNQFHQIEKEVEGTAQASDSLCTLPTETSNAVN